MLLPHNLTPDNFCSDRDDDTETIRAFESWLYRWFGEQAVETYEDLEHRAASIVRDKLVEMDERVPLPGSGEDTLAYMQRFLSPHEACALWHELLDTSVNA